MVALSCGASLLSCGVAHGDWVPLKIGREELITVGSGSRVSVTAPTVKGSRSRAPPERPGNIDIHDKCPLWVEPTCSLRPLRGQTNPLE